MRDVTEYANSVFEQPWWLDIVAPQKWGEVFVEEKGKIIARLPYVLDNKCIKNPSLTQTLGIWMDNSIKEKVRGNSHLYKQKEIINELIGKLPKSKSISITLDSSLEYVLPFRWLGFNIEPTFSYRISNIKNIVNFDNIISKNAFEKCKRASKKIVADIDNSDNGIRTIIELMDSTFKKQNRKNPHDRKFLFNMISTSILHNNGAIIIARDENGIAHSGAFYLYDTNVCYYLIGGKDLKYHNDYSQYLVIRKGLEFAKTVSNDFDFEGSMIEGIENFFRQFGGTQVINYHVSKQGIASEIFNIAKPKIKKLIGYKN